MPRSIGLNSEASEGTIPLARLETQLPQRPALTCAPPPGNGAARTPPAISVSPSCARLPIRHLKSLSSEAARVLLRRTYVRPCGDLCGRASHYFAIRQPAYRRHDEREGFNSRERQRKTVRQTGRVQS